MTQIPPYGTPAYSGAPQHGIPPYVQAAPADRIRQAWQRRSATDYIFDFWSALGWTILSCGIYGFYVFYQLIRRSRDHNVRSLELLDAATTFAWDEAGRRGLGNELRPAFERIAAHLAVLRSQTAEFRDPALWVLISLAGGSVAYVVGYILLDGDLVTHDAAEGAAQAELSAIYARLGAPVPPPDASRLKGKHSYGGRIAATIGTCGLYSLWWQYDVMVEGNRHLDHCRRWEDGLAQAVQRISSGA